MGCEKLAQVQAYYDQELDASASTEMEAHLERCAQCAELLSELRGLSLMISRAPLPGMPLDSISRYYGAWNVARDRGMVRVAGWLTAAAAVLLVAGLVMWPERAKPVVVKADAPEIVMMIPPAETPGDANSELVQIAQWMSNDLSVGERR